MLYALIEDVRSLYNVGAIFRTADGAGFSKIYLTGITACPPHREIRKVALGAEEHIPWEYHGDSFELVRKLQADDVQMVVLETTSRSENYSETEYKFPLCLVVGNELNGVSAGLVQAADSLIQIPMNGSKMSLNVSVAFGISSYEILRHKPDCLAREP